jgi:hypothetical protein
MACHVLGAADTAAVTGEAGGQALCSFEGVRQQSFIAMGSVGSLSLDWPFSTRDRVTTLSVAGAVHRLEPMDPYQAMVEHFADAVIGTGEMLFCLDDSWRQAAVIDRLFQSARG